MKVFTYLNRAIIIVLINIFPVSVSARGGSVPINYDALSFVEEPLAIDLDIATLNVNAIIDQGGNYNLRTDNHRHHSRILGNITLSTELPNSWDVGVQYFTRYNRNELDEYQDNLAFTIADEWGVIGIGNVTRSIFQNTRRPRGTGNANLRFIDFLGELDQDGLFYSVDYIAYHLMAASDYKGNAEVALAYRRPDGRFVYNTSIRARKGNTRNDDYHQNNTSDHGDTLGASWVGGILYGGYMLDMSVGYETVKIDNSHNQNDHLFTSLGMQYQTGAYLFSLEGSLGNYDGFHRNAASLGVRMDLARGLSLNLGLNYFYVNQTDNAELITSLRYSL